MSLSNNNGEFSGQQIGRYLVQDRLGSGGAASVYQAYDQVEGRSVALKVLLPTADANTISRFRREALTAGALRHPNIVRIWQVGTALQGEVAYIAMELVEGDSLATWLARWGRMRPEESCNLLQPIADALSLAHDAGVVHRDVKPSNILMRPASPGAPNSVQLESLDHPVVPLLTDFGIARALDAPELTNVGRTVGTPAYMAPEQCSGRREIDGRADLYSLGTVLYRCIVGRLPFSGSATQILHAHVYAPLLIDNETLYQLPPRVVTILSRCMAKSPADRYRDGAELAADLALAAGRRAYSPDPEKSDRGVETTATLTLSSLPAATPHGLGDTTILVPKRHVNGEPATENNRTHQSAVPPLKSAPRAPRRAQGMAQRLERFNWIGFGLTALGGMLLLLLITALMAGTVTIPALLDRSQPAALRSPSAMGAVGSLVNTPAASETAVGDGTGAGAVQDGALAIVPSPTPADQVAPREPAAPVVEASATPTMAPAPQPTEPQPAVPTVTDETVTDELVFSCSNVVDPVFVEYIAAMDGELAPEFRCAKAPAEEAFGAYVRFEYGFMLQLDNSTKVYIYYDINRTWELEAAVWQEGDPEPVAGLEAPSAQLYVPRAAIGMLWALPQRQARLGYATTEEPARFRAIEQSFTNGVLIKDAENGQVYVFPRSRFDF